MAAKTSAATERALARVKAGATPYAAAKAEGIALSTIYRAVRKPDETDYAYDVGAALGAICDRYGDKVTATAMGNISDRPNLLRTYLRHLDLSGFDIPAKPDGWRPGAASSSFWVVYYHGRSKGR
jgi:hypothetical protein